MADDASWKHGARRGHLAQSPRMPITIHFASGDLWGGAEAVVYTLIREQHRRDPQRVACVLMNRGQLADKLNQAFGG